MTPSGNLATVLLAGYHDALDRPFLVDPHGPTLTYRETHELASRVAGVLGAHGVVPGDRVVAASSKSPEAVALYLACLRIGAVYVPLNPGFTPDELDFFLDDSSPRVVVTDPEAAEVSNASRLTLDGHGGGSLCEAAGEAAPIDHIVDRAPDDLAAMLYTSGTTGRPKGAMLTHRGLTANATALHSVWGFGPDDVLLHSLPIFHVHGLFVALHCAMLSGCEVRFLRRFDVDDVLDQLPHCTVMMGVPTHYARLLADGRFGADRCAGVRLFTSGSAPMTEATHREFTERTGHRILERYGMTEAGIITSNPLEGDRIPGTVGTALPGMEMRTTTEGRVCGPGETGVVEVRGPHLFAGYWRLPETTDDAHDPDGWFVTGDVGAVDATGRLSLEGRASDMIISGGENVYPKEIELCLDAAPGVAESAVVGSPDADYGEIVVAFLVPEPGAGSVDLDDVRMHLGSRLARFKHPKRYVIVDELPRNTMGKVQKAALRDLAAAG